MLLAMRHHQTSGVEPSRLWYLPFLQLSAPDLPCWSETETLLTSLPVSSVLKPYNCFFAEFLISIVICLKHFLFCCAQNYPILYHASHFAQKHIHSFPANFLKNKDHLWLSRTLKSCRSNHFKETMPFVTSPKLSYIIQTITYVFFKYIRKHTWNLSVHSTIKGQMLHWFVLTKTRQLLLVSFLLLVKLVAKRAAVDAGIVHVSLRIIGFGWYSPVHVATKAKLSQQGIEERHPLV